MEGNASTAKAIQTLKDSEFHPSFQDYVRIAVDVGIFLSEDKEDLMRLAAKVDGNHGK